MGTNSNIRLDKPDEFIRKITLYGENAEIAGENGMRYAANVGYQAMLSALRRAPNYTKSGIGQYRAQGIGIPGRFLTGAMEGSIKATVKTTRGGNVSATLGYVNPPEWFLYQEKGTGTIRPALAFAQGYSAMQRAIFTEMAKSYYAAGDAAMAGKLMKRANEDPMSGYNKARAGIYKDHSVLRNRRRARVAKAKAKIEARSARTAKSKRSR